MASPVHRTIYQKDCGLFIKVFSRDLLCLSFSSGVFLGLYPWSSTRFSVQRNHHSRLLQVSLKLWGCVVSFFFYPQSKWPSLTSVTKFLLSATSSRHINSFMTVKLSHNTMTCWNWDSKIFGLVAFRVVVFFYYRISDALRQLSCRCNSEKELETISHFLCSKTIIHCLIKIMWRLKILFVFLYFILFEKLI